MQNLNTVPIVFISSLEIIEQIRRVISAPPDPQLLPWQPLPLLDEMAVARERIRQKQRQQPDASAAVATRNQVPEADKKKVSSFFANLNDNGDKAESSQAFSFGAASAGAKPRHEKNEAKGAGKGGAAKVRRHTNAEIDLSCLKKSVFGEES